TERCTAAGADEGLRFAHGDLQQSRGPAGQRGLLPEAVWSRNQSRRRSQGEARFQVMPLYRADHVGSLLRPREVLDARSDPRTTPERLSAIEDRHILQALQRQNDLGFRIFTDGELRRKGFMSDFYESVDGLDTDGSIARSWKGSTSVDGGSAAAVSAPLVGLVVERIRQKKRLTRHEGDFLTRRSPRDVMITRAKP